MDYPEYFEPKNSLNLYGLEKDFYFLRTLYSKNKFPNVLMLSGSRGVGKSTLVNHFLISIFDEKNYNKEKFTFINTSTLYKQIKNNIFQNILYLRGSDFKSVKIEDIRNLKSNIFQSTLLNKERFIILDDIELFNINSINALLKIIEEPNKNNYFILIDNKTKPLIETIRSRSIELKIILTEEKRLEIINNLMKFYNIESVINPENTKLTPGNFIKFNYIFKEYNISINNEFSDNLSLLLNLYKKSKDVLIIDIVFFLADLYFKNLNNKKVMNNDKIYELKSFVINNLDKYFTFNLNQNSLINAINNKLNHG